MRGEWGLSGWLMMDDLLCIHLHSFTVISFSFTFLVPEFEGKTSVCFVGEFLFCFVFFCSFFKDSPFITRTCDWKQKLIEHLERKTFFTPFFSSFL